MSNGAAELKEGDLLFTDFSQTFTIPQGATALRFTIKSFTLASNSLNPPDALEVALLDAQNGTSLIGTAAGLTQTDVLLNLQSSGRVYYSSKVTISGAPASGGVMTNRSSVVVTINLNGIPKDTTATLYFDLAGFGAANSSAAIDDVHILTGPPLSFTLDPATDSGVVGDDVTNFKNVNLVGNTDPGLTVLLDTNGAGFNDGKVVADNQGQFAFTNLTLTEGANTFRLQTTDPRGTTEAQAAMVLDTIAPTVLTRVINSGEAQRSMVTSIEFEFSENVFGSFSAEDLVLRNLTTVTNIAGAVFFPSSDSQKVTVTIRFPDLPNGSLPDGNYLATLLAAGVTDVAGNHPDGNSDGRAGDDYSFNFYRYYGDLDGDRDVDFADLYWFQKTWLKNSDDPNFDSRLDFDGNGSIDQADHLIYRAHYQTLLPAPALAPSGTQTNASSSADKRVENRSVMQIETNKAAVSVRPLLTHEASESVDPRSASKPPKPFAPERTSEPELKPERNVSPPQHLQTRIEERDRLPEQMLKMESTVCSPNASPSKPTRPFAPERTSEPNLSPERSAPPPQRLQPSIAERDRVPEQMMKMESTVRPPNAPDPEPKEPFAPERTSEPELNPHSVRYDPAHNDEAENRPGKWEESEHRPLGECVLPRPKGRSPKVMVNTLFIVLVALTGFCLPGWSGVQPKSREGSILLGTAVRTITPPLGVPLVGYPSPRPNTGVALDLCARAAVFGTPGKSESEVALVVLDVIHVDLELGRAIRERAAASLPGLPATAIMVSATHTHSGPAVSERYEGDTDTGREPGYLEKLIASAAEAVVAAWNSREEVHARIGHARARLGHNRRVVNAAGKATNEWKDIEGLHSGIFNPDLPFVVFDDARTRAIRAILVSYGCHPVVAGPANTKVSADYPGYLVRALESATKARTAIFITGAAGNINPRECLFAEPERARTMGEALAADVMESLPQTRPVKITPIAMVSVPLRVSVRPEAEERYAARLEEFPEGRRIVSEVQVLRLGELALVSAPGELVAEMGMAVQNSSAFTHTMIVYNANDHLGYLVTDAICREGGHEANSAVSLDVEKPYLAAAREALARAAAAGK